MLVCRCLLSLCNVHVGCQPRLVALQPSSMSTNNISLIAFCLSLPTSLLHLCWNMAQVLRWEQHSLPVSLLKCIPSWNLIVATNIQATGADCPGALRPSVRPPKARCAARGSKGHGLGFQVSFPLFCRFSLLRCQSRLRTSDHLYSAIHTTIHGYNHADWPIFAAYIQPQLPEEDHIFLYFLKSMPQGKSVGWDRGVRQVIHWEYLTRKNLDTKFCIAVCSVYFIAPLSYLSFSTSVIRVTSTSSTASMPSYYIDVPRISDSPS